jgi:GNAT superfamily N-acetyltransferase
MWPEYFNKYKDVQAESFAQDLASAQGWPIDTALKFAKQNTESQLAAGCDTPGEILLVGTDEDSRSIGAAWFSKAHTAGEYLLADFRLNPEVRGGGLAKPFLTECLAYAERCGVVRVNLNVFTSNSPALALYRKMGWQEVAVKMTLCIPPQRA